MFAKDNRCIHLPDFSSSEIVALFRLLMGTIKTDVANDTLRTIADQLDGLPLAISQAGSYMLRHHLSPLEHKYILDKTRKDHVATFSLPIKMSLDRSEIEELPALEILCFMSILDASHVPKYLLLNRSLDLKSRISMEDLDGLIAFLLSYSLAHLTPDQTYLDVHRLLQIFIRRRLYKEGRLAAWENVALKAVSYQFPQGSFEECQWEKCGDLLPHALAVLKYDVVKDDENSIHRFRLLRNVGAYTMTMGRYQAAEKLLQEAYVVSMKQFGPGSMNSQSVATLLARLFPFMGRPHGAEKLEVRAMEMSLRVLGAEHPDTLRGMSNLASALSDKGKYQEAEDMYRQALVLMERVLGKEHPSTLNIICNLVIVLIDKGKYQEAKDIDGQKLALKERVVRTGRFFPASTAPS